MPSSSECPAPSSPADGDSAQLSRRTPDCSARPSNLPQLSPVVLPAQPSSLTSSAQQSPSSARQSGVVACRQQQRPAAVGQTEICDVQCAAGAVDGRAEQRVQTVRQQGAGRQTQRVADGHHIT